MRKTFRSLNQANRTGRISPLSAIPCMLAIVCLLVGCARGPEKTPDTVAEARSHDTGIATVARPEAKTTSPEVETSCEARFWRTTVVRNNAGLADAPAVADGSYRYLRNRVEALNARGAHITVGGVLALLVFEGRARVAFYNDRCKENSYVRTRECWKTPKARYSYQYGLGAIHTSLFHPCKAGPAMRRRMNDSLRARGFTPSAADISSITPALRSVCAKAVPDAVDYYILAAHDKFGIPQDSDGNLLAAIGRFPFFSPEVSIDLFFEEIGSNPARLSSDPAMVAVYGGGDKRYRKPAFQSSVLGTYASYRDRECR